MARLTIAGASACTCAFKIDVGIMSSGDDLSGMLPITANTSFLIKVGRCEGH